MEQWKEYVSTYSYGFFTFIEFVWLMIRTVSLFYQIFRQAVLKSQDNYQFHIRSALLCTSIVTKYILRIYLYFRINICLIFDV